MREVLWRRMAAMWMGPALFLAVSVFLWRFAGAVFMPVMFTRLAMGRTSIPADLEIVVLINAWLIYFGAYFVFAMFWERLKPYLKNPFLAGFVLWLVNVLVVFPLIGRGVLGYRMPQGWMGASFPMLVSHWLFARGLQFQQRRK